MALNKEVLKVGLIQLMNDVKDNEKSIEDFADGLSTLIDTFVKTGTVTVASPIPVTVVIPSGIGGTTAPGTGTIS